MRVGLYPGSFDPVTYGHVDIVRRAGHLWTSWSLPSAPITTSIPLFTAKERVDLVAEVLDPVARQVGLELEVSTYDNLTIDAAREALATVVIRGLTRRRRFRLRDADGRHESGPCAGDRDGVSGVLARNSRHIAASLVRQIAAMGGDVSAFVPPIVAAALKKKFAG